ncbi:MAG: 30S ribosomal protein S16 [Balneola sp.]|nr:30S ribosomal protein S16 [Balneola sp.]MBO6649830.1 30S ribosomal protein S16 [Balneola sp.]MBO6712393.1 30S ribosomal protein S16 [Balneola sp.]MBO6801456.1 30S ribosomal protein S16 [Balneola sp.]MBO6871730.1 30S ribosomal protein S16 [Balneola sp.]
MIRIRLQKKGRKKRPIFHIVVADSKVARDGRIIEQVGRYDNVTEKKEVVLNEDRILYWLDTGAQPSDTVRKILRNEGVLYKRHLMMWGKSEEEIETALAEWKSYRDSKGDDSDSRKDKHKDVLAAEEKEFKDQVQKKAAKAAVELETESSDEEVAAETEATEEVATEEAPAEEEVVEEAAPEATEEPEVEAKEAAEEVEENVAEATEEPATEEATVEETEDAPAEEEKEEVAEEPKAEASSTQTSDDMTAKEAIDHIRDTDLDALKGFISDDESRKTVIAAWESKQSEG